MQIFSMTDEQAMWRVQTQADERAFAQLVSRWQGPIQRLCTRMTGDAHCGEDLAQEAFVRVFARRKEYQPAAKFSTWLWRIALNLSYDELRRRRRHGEWAQADPAAQALAGLEATDAPDAAPDRLLMAQEHGELVRRALARLPESYRTVLVLRHYEDLKFREIAAVLELPEGTVKSRMAVALTQMGRLLHTALAEPGASPITDALVERARPARNPAQRARADGPHAFPGSGGCAGEELKTQQEPKESLTL